MTKEELWANRELSVIENVFCTRCGEQYPSGEMVFVKEWDGTKWLCPTKGCQGKLGTSLHPAIVTKG